MKKKILKWIAILFVAFVVLSAVLLFSLSIWNSVVSKKWLSSPSEDGELVDVGGHSLFCVIKGNGRPVVVFEGDVGSSSAEWLSIQRALPSNCTSLIYDRAGYGWSGAGSFPRSPGQIVSELTSLLKAKGLEQGPFILVGQGLGGYYLQHFAQANKTKVRAMILSEPYSSAYPQFRKKLDPVVYKNLLDRTPGLKMAKILSKVGLIRFFNATPYRYTPPEIRKYIVENYSNPHALDVMLDEYKNGPIRDAEKLSLPRVPITVIHHNVENFRKEYVNFYLSYNEIETIESLWIDMFSDITRQSSSARMIYAKGSIGAVNLEEPELIINEILFELKK